MSSFGARAFGLLANTYFTCRLIAEQHSRALHWGAAGVAGAVWLVTGAYLALVSLQSGYVMLQTFRGWQARELILASQLRNEAVAAENPMPPYPHLSKMPLFLGSASLKKALGVQGTRLRGVCELDGNAYLSRIVCAFDTAKPELAFTQFTEVDFPQTNTPPSHCNLDYVGGQTPDGSVTHSSPLRIDGWARPAASHWLPMLSRSTVFLVGERQTYAADAGAATPRNDVAAFVAYPRYRWSGFSIYAGTAQVVPGNYVIYLRAGDAAPCRTDKSLRLP